MDNLELQLTGMAHGGKAVGRHKGKAVFVPYGIAGERIRAQIEQDKGRFAEASIVEILESSDARTQPRCVHFGICGGCHWQHIVYNAQLEFKRQIVQDQLVRIGGFKDVPVNPTLPSPDPWYYRSHISLHTTEAGEPGFVAANSSNVIPIHECHIIRPELLEMLQNLPPLKPRERLRLQVGSLTSSDARVHHKIKDRTFQVTVGSFFQVNLSQAEVLVSLVLEKLALQGSEHVLDLYSGVGLFTAFLAERARRVTAIESSPGAVRDAKENLSAWKHVEILEGKAEVVLRHQRFDVVVTDPPRTGMKLKVLTALSKCRTQKIVYVSCDPATFARDARHLAENGYLLVEVQPVDMFPQTYHIELVATLVRA